MSIVAAAASLLAGCNLAATSTAAQEQSTGTVQTITAVTSVSSSGSALALQTASVSWKAGGTVGTVLVKPGDQVQAGDTLMTIDPASASASYLQAQVELSSTVQALNDLLHPPAATLATARQAVAQAQEALENAQKTLAAVEKTDLDYYQEQVEAAQNALLTAEQNSTATDIGQLPVQLRQAQAALLTATNVYNDAKVAFANCPDCLKVWAYDRKIAWDDAVILYTDAVNKVEQIQIQIDQAQRQNATGVTAAQEDLTAAENNLAWAQAGTSATTLALDEAAVAVAKANLATAQDTLDHLLNGADPEDVLAAQAKVASAQAALDAYTLTAPIAGEVLAVNFQPGDVAASNSAAVTIANRQYVRVEASVDESDISKIQVGDPVTITFDAVTDLALPATVTWVSSSGAATQGLVKYTVRIDSTTSDPRVLLGMTANVLIVTDTQTGALAVPLAAVQYDTQGEFVNRVGAGGSLERVNVQSGQIQNGLVIVAGNLKNGDVVELATSTSTTSSSTTGGPGGGLLGGLGGGRGGP
jgi:HlyD family secretion protein